ncbi:WD40 repeat-like protein [Mycena pura]|uniref:WD40 repeat-like protein n=1 Tax=Mycena pura TaxID=153505 RepID=A0AAD6XXE5_9AGAR|nr:WD40 repeat-like protein [Mycena pura]
MPNAMWPFFNKREGQDKAAMFNSGHKNTWCQAELDEYITDHPIDKTGLDDAAFLRVHAERTSIPSQPDPLLGECEITIEDLLHRCGPNKGDKSGVFLVVELDVKVDGKASGRVSVCLKSIEEAAQNAKYEMQKDIERLSPKGLASSTVDAAAQAGAAQQDLATALGLVLFKLDFVVKMGDELAEAHPYVDAAWKILTSVHKAVKNQRDKKIVKLVTAMCQVYSFVDQVEFLTQKIEALEGTITSIAKQTVECAIFIREYTGHGFSGRLARTTFTDTDQKIKNLSTALLNLKDSFDRGEAIQAVVLSANIDIKVSVQSDMLETLSLIDVDASLRLECLPGTRRELLRNITEWLTTPSATSNVLWLHGVAGSGKSTILTTISQCFRDLGRLGAFIFFDLNNNPASSNAKAVIHSIAYWVAKSNPHVQAALCDAIAREPTLVNAPIRIQFQKLLHEPLVAAKDHICGPIVIILDVLDECVDRNSRDMLVALLVDELPKLPPVFRFFITSRPDAEIASRFQKKPHITPMLLDIAADTTKGDILSYLRRRMQDIRQDNQHLGRAWPGDQTIRTLADHSGGLFIWAVTAYKFMRGYNPEEKLALLLSHRYHPGSNLDQLYTLALESSAPWTDGIFARDACAVLGTIVLAQAPITGQAIDSLRGFKMGTTANVLKHLGCVIQIAGDQTARMLHASLRDYITDSSRSGTCTWFVHGETQSQSLALGCFRVLHSQLRFNICGLENSHLLNSEVSDITRRLAQHLSPELAYASQYWANHLRNMAPDNQILTELRIFIKTGFLYWLEVLSLLEQIGIGRDALQLGRTYVPAGEKDLELSLRDAERFLDAFAPVIAQSAPHVYISALAFAPKQSKVLNNFASHFPRILRYSGPSDANWVNFRKVIREHKDSVYSVAFSPDGRRIASGSDDRTVRIWDSETGIALLAPLNGHADGILSVAFSPDGKRVVSGSSDCTVRIWDSESGAAIGAAMKSHTDAVVSVAFFPNGRQILSGSIDKTARIWDPEAGALRSVPLTGHTKDVRSVALSPDGRRFVSGSDDHTVRIWDSETGAALGAALNGHTDTVWAVAFSPDGRRIASGSFDRTVRIWDSETGTALGVPLNGHGFGVRSVAFSYDGKRIVSGSDDYTVRIWDSETGAALGAPMDGHRFGVCSVAFSPDGTRIVSGSGDHTVRIWDPETDTALSAPLNGHTSIVFSVAFSPDGRQIITGAGDSTVRIWDSETGAALGGPLNGHTGNIRSVAFFPGGKRIVSGSYNGTMRIWDSETGTALGAPLTGHTESVWSVAFSPDGIRIATGSADNTVRMWDSETGAAIGAPLTGHTGTVYSVAFSPDGRCVMSCSADKTVRLWNSETGAALFPPGSLYHRYGHITSTAFSPDGRRVATGFSDGTVYIWHSLAGTGASPVKLPSGHTSNVFSIAFSPDGRQIVTGGARDSTARIWDSETGAALGGPLDGHVAGIISIAFSPDGRRIVSGSYDGTVRVWKVHKPGIPISVVYYTLSPLPRDIY